MIYAYADSHPTLEGMLKIGFTSIDVEKRVAAQYPTLRPGPKPYTIVFAEPALRDDGTSFTDHDIHRAMKRMDMQYEAGEWFTCTVDQVRAAYISVRIAQRTLKCEARILKCAPNKLLQYEKH